jgi:hypothetical protein
MLNVKTKREGKKYFMIIIYFNQKILIANKL